MLGWSTPLGPPMTSFRSQSRSIVPLRWSKRYSPHGTPPQSHVPAHTPSGFGLDGDGTAGDCSWSW